VEDIWSLRDLLFVGPAFNKDDFRGVYNTALRVHVFFRRLFDLFGEFSPFVDKRVDSVLAHQPLDMVGPLLQRRAFLFGKFVPLVHADDAGE
jgi:hypothetical protein